MLKCIHKIAFSALIIASSSIFAAEKQYYAIFMDGQKIGYSVHSRTIDGPKVTTSDSVEISVTRAGIPISLSQVEKCIETRDGRPLGFESTLSSGLGKQTIKGVVSKTGQVNVSTSMGAAAQKQTLDWPEGALMAEGMRILQEKAGLKPGTVLTAKMFVPSTLSAVDANITILKPEKLDLLGRVVSLIKVETSLMLDGTPMRTISYIDNELNPQKTIMPVMGMNMEMVACNRQFALSKNDVVDFIDKSMVPCPVSLKNAETARSVVYTMTPVNSAKLNFLASDTQTITRASDDTVTLTAVSLTAPSGGKLPYTGTDPNVLKALKPSRYVQNDNKVIFDLAKKAAGNASDPAQAAKNITDFVRGYISDKNFSVGYASAVEVAQSREGDCSEHAVLTAALCKAVGIPAQVVFGILYVDEFEGRNNVFVGHAWTRCYINGKWLDYDATRHATGPTRISMAAGDGDPDQFFSMLSTFGNFKITNAVISK